MLLDFLISPKLSKMNFVRAHLSSLVSQTFYSIQRRAGMAGAVPNRMPTAADVKSGAMRVSMDDQW